MEPPDWTPTEAATQLAEGYAESRGEDATPEPLDALALALSDDPEYLEETWATWQADMQQAGWTEKRIDAARCWLDLEVLGELATR